LRLFIPILDRVWPYLTMSDSFLNRIGRMAIVWKRIGTLVEWTLCTVVYTVSNGLIRSHAISRGLVRPIIQPYTDMTFVPGFKSFKSHTRLSQIHSDDPSVTRIRPRLVRLYVRFTRVASCVSRVFCVRW